MTEDSDGQTAGERLRNLRIALGYAKRPKFAELMGMKTARLNSIEHRFQKMNEDDFRVVAEHWPWATNYIAKGGQLVIPEEVECPVNELVDSVGELNKAAANLQIESADDFAKAMASNPEVQKAMEDMMRNIMTQALASKGGDEE